MYNLYNLFLFSTGSPESYNMCPSLKKSKVNQKPYRPFVQHKALEHFSFISLLPACIFVYLIQLFYCIKHYKIILYSQSSFRFIYIYLQLILLFILVTQTFHLDHMPKNFLFEGHIVANFKNILVCLKYL